MHCGVKDPAGRACARIPAPGEQKLRHAAASRSSRLLEAESSRQPSSLPSIGSGSLPRLMDWTYQAPRAPRGCTIPRKHPGEAQSGFLWASSLIPYDQPGGPKLTDRVTITTLSTLLNLSVTATPDLPGRLTARRTRRTPLRGAWGLPRPRTPAETREVGLQRLQKVWALPAGQREYRQYTDSSVTADPRVTRNWRGG